jgi:hypothetical protein
VNGRQEIREHVELGSERASRVDRISAILAILGVNDLNPPRKNRRQGLDKLRTGPQHRCLSMLETRLPGHHDRT